jgi:dTDP-glucose 4,6-dehydratase
MENDNLNRPGHDLRYSLDGSKLIEMGWKHPVSFSESLRKTIEWTVKNPEWLNW